MPCRIGAQILPSCVALARWVRRWTRRLPQCGLLHPARSQPPIEQERPTRPAGGRQVHPFSTWRDQHVAVCCKTSVGTTKERNRSVDGDLSIVDPVGHAPDRMERPRLEVRTSFRHSWNIALALLHHHSSKDIHGVARHSLRPVTAQGPEATSRQSGGPHVSHDLASTRSPRADESLDAD